MRCLTIVVTVLLALLAPLAYAAPVAGIVDDALLRPYEWAQGTAAAWSTANCAAAYAKAGFETRVLHAEDLTPDGLARLQVIVIPGDHVYPERGKWGGPVIQALAGFVRAGGVYVMPVGIPHWVARDIATGARDGGHFGPDALGLSYDVTPPATPLALTAQGRALGLPDPSALADAPVRTLRWTGPLAILAWAAYGTPATEAVPIGRGFALHCGLGEKGEPVTAAWWFEASAKAARAALDGRLRVMTVSETVRHEGLKSVSLDDLDRRAFRPDPSPMTTPAITVPLRPGAYQRQAGRVRVSLDGTWEMVGRDPGAGSEAELVTESAWPGAIPAKVPCSVHTALLAAGKIPDPSVGFNADIARKGSYREWWFRRTFARPAGLRDGELVFDGVDYSCTVWINGERLGRHEGAFGGPEFEVGGLLRDRNTLVVRVDPVPNDWTLVFKTNVVYGWHYVNLPSLGIWQSVRLEGRPAVRIDHPFVATRDARRGVVDLCATLTGLQPRWSGTLRGTIEPANFRGKPEQFAVRVASSSPSRAVHLRFRIPSPRLWWPVDLGAPNLYRLRLAMTPAGGTTDTATTTFGIRTIATKPLPEGPLPGKYRWTFVINDRPVFLKGANWCILDALLRLDRARYARFLTLARNQHTQLLRAWGGGLLETNTFYDLCDRLGVMVYQEFPLTWQKFDVLSPSVVDETAVRNVRRLRNHPSLLMWGGGNEHSGQGRAVEQIGRACLALDGTRPFHRTDPYGGSLHNYDVYWGRAPLERNLTLSAPFIGEFGLASPPSLESVMRYLPPKERGTWPPPDDGSFVRHTPTFNKVHMEIMRPYVSEFASPDTMAGFITGMQLAQATGLRHPLELARTRWPEATGACYYKLTDVYPAVAWASIDWYGVPKIAYWMIQQAYAPLHACALFEHLAVPKGEGLSAPIVLFDDTGRLHGKWSVVARAFDGSLREVASRTFDGAGQAGRVKRLGTLDLPAAQAQSVPLLIVTEVRAAGRVADRTFYWLNYAARQGSLFRLPKTHLSMRAAPGRLIVRNEGDHPAVGVHFDCRAISDRFTVEQSYLWLDPGEERVLRASAGRSVKVTAWNADSTPPSPR